MSDFPDKAGTIVKQAAAKLTAWGFPNNPIYRGEFGKFGTAAPKAVCARRLTTTVEVWKISEIVPEGDVFVLVILKGHKPQEAYHVVDFRVGDDIYGDVP